MADQDNLTSKDETKETAQCSICAKVKPYTEFHEYAAGYRRLQCIVCERQHGKERRKEHKIEQIEQKRVRDRRSDLKRHFGMTREEYRNRFEIQNGLCAICKKPSSNHRTLAVDHDAKTGAIRALLCDKCNRGIGLLQHDPEILQAAIVYLKAYQSNNFKMIGTETRRRKRR